LGRGDRSTRFLQPVARRRLPMVPPLTVPSGHGRPTVAGLINSIWFRRTDTPLSKRMHFRLRNASDLTNPEPVPSPTILRPA
jgi:hypothetical protein